MNVTQLASALTCLLLSSCTMHSTATHWSGRVGPDGKPVFIKSSTNIGVNLLVAVPFLGSVTLDSMVGETSGEIAKEQGDHLRAIETTSENYWYGFPPFTWILTPVVTTVNIEYQPSTAEHAKEMERQRAEG